MTEKAIRIGIVGAGANTRLRHIPGFRKIPGVQLRGVVNRSAQSSRVVAQEFEIPRVFETWQGLVESDEIDAVMIGTWPNLHCEVTCAALKAGKHVLTEARMARNLAEARTMQQAAAAHPKLVTQVVPSPFGLAHGPYIRRLIDENFVGELRELVVIGADSQFFDYSQPLHWRQDRSISGNNVLTLGILHETATRWTPLPVSVFAQTAIFEKERPVPSESRTVEVTVPESVQVLTAIQGGGRGIYHFSGVDLHGPGKQIHLYGSRGTIKVKFDPHEEVWIGRVGDRELRKLELPQDQLGGWRVEEEFIGAIRGEEEVRLNDFGTAVKYMEFTEAVAISAEKGTVVRLPIV